MEDLAVELEKSELKATEQSNDQLVDEQPPRRPLVVLGSDLMDVSKNPLKGVPAIMKLPFLRWYYRNMVPNKLNSVYKCLR